MAGQCEGSFVPIVTMDDFRKDSKSWTFCNWRVPSCGGGGVSD